MIHHSQILASLKKHAGYLQEAVHREIADGLVADGLADRGEVRASATSHAGLTHIQSIEAARANPETVRLFDEVRATAARMGYHFPANGYVNPRDLDIAIRAQSTENRMLLKSQLADPRLRLIP